MLNNRWWYKADKIFPPTEIDVIVTDGMGKYEICRYVPPKWESSLSIVKYWTNFEKMEDDNV